MNLKNAPKFLIIALAVLLGLAALGSHQAQVVRADAGFTSVPGPNIHPLSSGGYAVQVLAVTEFDASVNIALAPNPTIDWGDGNTDTVTQPNAPNIQYILHSGPTQGCTSETPGGLVYGPGGSCSFELCSTNCSGGALTGTHIYPGFGTWTVTATYNTGCCISYSTSWTVSIQPPAQATVDLVQLGVLRSDHYGDGSLSFSPAPIGGGAQTCPPACNPTWDSGTTVTITPVPNSASVFSRWTTILCGKGGCAPALCASGASVSPCQIALPQLAQWATQVYAVFQPAPDTTPPLITASATTADSKAYTAGTWTSQSVTVGFSCADTGAVQSGIATNTVAGVTLSIEGANQSVTNTGACVDRAGNSASAVSFGPINIDKAKPAITVAATTADGKPYTAGVWTNQAVTIGFACADTGSVQSGLGTNTIGGGATISTETAGQSVTNTGACIDNAGNSADPATFGPIMIDKTPPLITATATTADGKSYTAGTWTNQTVTVAFSCADTGSVQSGLATNTVGGGTVSSETSGQTVTSTGSCVDNADNAATATTFGPVKIDKTKPVIAATATTADGKPYTGGAWTNQAVTVKFSCADTGAVQSGIATNTVAGQMLTSETSSSGQSVTSTGSCIDNAGNQATPASFGPIMIDKTRPALICSASPSSIWPPNHKLVDVAATVTLSDSLSGPNGYLLKSATASGDPSDIQGFTAGQASTSGQVRANKDEGYTLTYQGADKAGNTAACTVTITVPHDQGGH